MALAGEGRTGVEGSPARAEVPRLADGVQLIGEYEGSGFKEPPSLVRRPDGQVIQLSPLLYLVAQHADGTSDYGAIAEKVGHEIHRQVSADNVRLLVDEKLRPLGVLAAADGLSPTVRKLDPLLALKFKAAVIPAGASRVVAAVFRPLFLPPVIVAAVVGLLLVDGWLFFHHGIAQGVRDTLYQPGMVLLVFGVVVASAAFHEIGHAAACSYGGGQPGKMGCGLYLAWPAFYTDVTDAYRLGRMARLRTDLGGVYFNVIVILATTGAYALTGFEGLLMIIVLQHAEIVHQLLPLVRLDGYYIVADLTGVPDLFARIKPILVSVVPGKKADERVTVLKPWVRAAVTMWVLVVVPLLAFQLLMLLVHLPRILGTGWDSLSQQLDAVSKAFGEGRALSGVASIVQALLVTLPLVAIILMLARLGHRGVRGLWRRTEGRPLGRAAAMVLLAVVAVVLAMAWIPSDNYEPIREGERGTWFEGVSAVRSVPGGRGPLASHRAAEQRGDLDSEARAVPELDGRTSPSGLPARGSGPATSRTAPRAPGATSTTSTTRATTSTTRATTSTTRATTTTQP